MELDTPDGRKKYLSEKLDNLLDGINDYVMSIEKKYENT